MPRRIPFALIVLAVPLAGCLETDDQSARPDVTSTATPNSTAPAASVAVEAVHIQSCVEQIQFGAFAGDPAWTEMWNQAGETEAGAHAACAELATTSPSEAVKIHEDWVAFQAFAAAQQPATTPAPPLTAREGCEPAYPDVCIPIGSPELNCPDIPYTNFTVLAPDPHGFDGNNNNGVGCEA